MNFAGDKYRPKIGKALKSSRLYVFQQVNIGDREICMRKIYKDIETDREED